MMRLKTYCMMPVVSAFENIPRKKRRDLGRIEQAVERALRSEARETWGKKPIISVFVTKV